jgi:hypothetical protein
MMSKPDDIRKKIIVSVAKQLGSPIKQVELIVGAQSAYAKHIMESGSMEGIAFPYFGKLIVSAKRLKKVNYRETFKRAKQDGLIQRRARKYNNQS